MAASHTNRAVCLARRVSSLRSPVVGRPTPRHSRGYTPSIQHRLDSGPSVSASASASTATTPTSTTSTASTTPTSTSTTSTTTSTTSPLASSPLAAPTTRLARVLQRRAPGVVDTYVAYSATAAMARQCWLQADYSIKLGGDGPMAKTAEGEDLGTGSGWWFSEANLPPAFSTWSHVTMLHLYIVLVRLRQFPTSSTRTWHQHLIDHFFVEAERRMESFHGLTMRALQQRYLKDLYTQWRGVLAGYDEGFVKGDAVLATAVWRNVFKASPDVDAVVLAQVVSHMRRSIADLDEMADHDFGSGNWAFAPIEDERNVVLAKSRFLQQ